MAARRGLGWRAEAIPPAEPGGPAGGAGMVGDLFTPKLHKFGPSGEETAVEPGISDDSTTVPQPHLR